MDSPTTQSFGEHRSAAIALLLVVIIVAALAAVLTSRLPGAGSIAYAASPKPDASAQLDVLYAQLDESWNRHDWPKSIQALSAIVLLDPSNQAMQTKLYQAHVNLAWQLLADQSFTQADEQFRQALRIAPDGDEAQVGLELLQQLIIPSGGAAPPPTTAPPIVCTPIPHPTIVPDAPVCTPTPQPPVCPTPATLVVPQKAPDCQAVSCCDCVYHVVRTGDTLFGLARRFNTTVEAIMAANGLTTCTIRVCQVLLIPVGTCPPVICAPCPPTQPPPVCAPIVACQPVCPPPQCPVVCPPVAACPPAIVPAVPCIVTTHVVQRGEDLFRLAIRYNVSVSLLMKANGLTTTTVKAGQVLLIP